MKRYRSILFLFLLLGIICSCHKPSSPSEIAQASIRERLDTISNSFNNIDLDGIMGSYDEDFLHNGDNWHDERITWQERLSLYNHMEVSDIVIELNGDRATCRFKVTFSAPNVVNEYITPDDIGDMSYYISREDNWLLYGNQHNGK